MQALPAHANLPAHSCPDESEHLEVEVEEEDVGEPELDLEMELDEQMSAAFGGLSPILRLRTTSRSFCPHDTPGPPPIAPCPLAAADSAFASTSTAIERIW